MQNGMKMCLFKLSKACIGISMQNKTAYSTMQTENSQLAFFAFSNNRYFVVKTPSIKNR